MRKLARAAVALVICLSGWALVPFTSMPSQAFGWELFAGAYGEIFSDDFETGDTGQWDRVVGEVDLLVPESADEMLMSFWIDDSSWDSKEFKILTLVTGYSDKDVPAFKLEARRRGHLFEVRARAVSEPNVWAESPWRTVDGRYQSIELEWRRSLDKREDGLLYVSVDDELLLWLVDLDNSYLPLRGVERTYLGSRPVAPMLGGTLSAPVVEAD